MTLSRAALRRAAAGRRCAFPQCDGTYYAPCDTEFNRTWVLTGNYPRNKECVIKFRRGEVQQLKPLTEDATEFAESLSPVRRPRVRVRVCHRTRARSRDLGAARSARAGARACCVTTGGSGADHVHPGRGRLESRAAVGV